MTANRSACTNRHLLLSSAALISAALSAQAAAQTLARVDLPGIEVTAGKTARDAFQLAESVSVVERETIEREQPALLGDLLEDLPNVSIGGGPRGAGQQVFIRGIGDERVLFLLDGARQNFSRAHNARVFVDPELLKRVEVLRGPASALWGSGAIGGVVALATKDAADMLAPGESAGARVKLGYQGVNDQWLTGATGYSLLGDTIDLLVDVNRRDADDTELGGGTTLDNSAYESTGGLFKLTWAPAPEHELATVAQVYDDEAGVPSNPQTLGTAADLVDRETRQVNLSARYSYESPDSTWLRPSVLLFRNLNDIDERRRTDARLDQTELTTWGFDLRNRFSWSGAQTAHDLYLGVDYFEDSAEARRNGAPRPSFPDAEQRVLGVYLHDEIRIGERVTLVPGLRWDRYESESAGAVAPSQEESELSRKLSLSWEPIDGVTLHAAYNEAFRAPGVSELFVSGTHFSCGPGCANLFVPNPDLRPEKAHNKEIGLRLERSGLFAPGDRGRASLAVFRNDVEDFIDQLVNFTFVPVPGNPGPGGVSFFDNVDDARLEGFEAELRYDAPGGFLNAGYGRTRGENRATGAPLSAIPAGEFTLGGGVRLASNQVVLGWKSRFVEAQDRVPAGGTPTDSYDLHDVYLTWRPQQFGRDRVRLDFGVDNLFDSNYRPHLSVLDGPGRNVKATVTVRF